MNHVIIQAIQEKKCIEFTYDHIIRTVEPYTYGITKNDHELVRCYQIKGNHSSLKHHDWCLFDVNEIKSLSLSEESFSGSRIEYKKGDKVFRTIYAEI
jgi:hypothetical protein